MAMKHLSLIFILSLSTQLFAQSKTGAFIGEIETGPTGYFVPTWRKFAALNKVLSSIEQNCINNDRSYIPNQTFMESYIKLSLNRSMKNLYQPGVQNIGSCELDDRIKMCLNSLQLKVLMFQIKNDPDVYLYLKANHGLDRKSADKMLNFFADP